MMIVEILIAALLGIAGVVGLIGSYGMIKLADPMQRLHAPSKATTLGVAAVLLASVLDAGLIRGQASWHEVLIVLFLFATAPVTALFIAKVHLHHSVPRADLPPTGTARDWATIDATPPGPQDSA
ncbi:MAG: Na+/H+ antiporter subunit G [Rhodobacteraceae bacterium CG2_30_10_405]|nr:MAG: Na+/H+ antiporter subunit G [Rhodobacteraceae bacterium CG2_30_10_405]